MAIIWKNKCIKITAPFKSLGKLASAMVLVGCAGGFSLEPVRAEGSRTLYPASTPIHDCSDAISNSPSSPDVVCRAQLEWSTTQSLMNLIERRTLLRVYAVAGEYILLGSSAVDGEDFSGTGNPGQAVDDNGNPGDGDIVVYAPGTVSGTVGNEILPATPEFTCNGNGSNQQGGDGDRDSGNDPRGVIDSRDKELAGPGTVSGMVMEDEYLPCYYLVETTGIHHVAFFGPEGENSIALPPFQGGDLVDFDEIRFEPRPGGMGPNPLIPGQRNTVAAWDVTVRSSDVDSTTDLNGRVYTYYLSMLPGLNRRPTSFTVYTVTNDGYIYSTDIDGIDPNGFTVYGNQRGFLDSDDNILYRDVVSGANGGPGNNLVSLLGGTQGTVPQYPIFLNNPITSGTNLAVLLGADLDGNINVPIPASPTLPEVNPGSLAFMAAAPGASIDAFFNVGGQISFESNVNQGNYELVISRDQMTPNFDPSLGVNATLRGVIIGNSTTVTWDGTDNNGDPFPVGDDYPLQVRIRGGEYHFPLLDAESNFRGGPIITLLNLPGAYPLDLPGFGVNTAFFDDRIYEANGVTVSDENGANPGGVHCGSGPPPSPGFSDQIMGFDTTNLAPRAYGNSTGIADNGNGNNCSDGTFGDKKGLDLWTFFPSAAQTIDINIVDSLNPDLVLAKRITGVNEEVRLGFNDVDTDGDGTDNNDDDNDPNWPVPNTTSLGGTLRETNEPGDEVEFTIYFLSRGEGAAENFSLCDAVPPNMTFLETAFNGQGPQDEGGTVGANLGIALALNDDGTGSVPTVPTDYLTNINDGDRGQFLPATTPSGSLPGSCLKPNPSFDDMDPASEPFIPLDPADYPNGLVVVDIVTSETTPVEIPPATAPGDPSNSYGFIRFRAVVD